MHPLLSVIIPTRNRRADLDRCLDAVLVAARGLERDQLEVIVSDDARSEELREHLSMRYPGVLWVPGPAAGPAANRNAGARHARGAWLVFTDDDCIPTPRWLSGFAGAIAAGRLRALEGRVTSEPGPKSAWDEAPVNLSGGCFWSCNIAVEAGLFWEVGGFDENYPFAAMEDVDLRVALTEKDARLVFVPVAEVNHPARAGGLRLRLSRLKQLQSHVYFRRKWSGPRPWSEYIDLLRATAWHWFWVPLRQGNPLLAAAAPVAVVYMTLNFASWYRHASRAVEGRRVKRPP